jgi:hypothetical protein
MTIIIIIIIIKVTLLWNQQIQPDRTIPNNKPDMKRMLIDVTITGDRNVTQRETEKILKYSIRALQ